MPVKQLSGILRRHKMRDARVGADAFARPANPTPVTSRETD